MLRDLSKQIPKEEQLVTVIIPVFISVCVGAGLFLWGKNSKSEFTVNSTEFAIGLVVSLVISFTVAHFGTKIAINHAVGGYKEFWNGSIVSSGSGSTACTRDGDCENTYDCDPYEVVDIVPNADGKGTHIETHTEYHSCPYVTREYSYWLDDSFGDSHYLMYHGFAANPQQWRRGEGIPGDVPRGIPVAWIKAVKELRAGDLPPATKINKYDNYILASARSILKEHSDDVATYKKQGLLVAPTVSWKSPLINGFTANKVVFVKTSMTDQDQWQNALNHLNSALGAERQGDMHMLVVRSSAVNDPDAYARTLIAYWQSKEFGKWALGKNTIAVIVGVSDDGKTVQWARAKTGMPIGNGQLLAAISFIPKGTSADPQTLIGYPVAKWNGKKLLFTRSGGVIERIVLDTSPFIRGCMDCKDKGDQGTSYVYLKKELHPSGTAKFWIAFLSLILNGLMWYGFYSMPFFEPLTSNGRYNGYYS